VCDGKLSFTQRKTCALRVVENSVLRRISPSKREQMRLNKKYIIRNFITSSTTNYYYDDQITDELDAAYSTHGDRSNTPKQIIGRDLPENLDIHGIILKLILKIYGGKLWAGIIRIRAGSNGGL
jgi:hypothetical protein